MFISLSNYNSIQILKNTNYNILILLNVKCLHYCHTKDYFNLDFPLIAASNNSKWLFAITN